MQFHSNQNGIISYAGLPKQALLSEAKRLFSQAQGDVPERFAVFLPLFPFELVENMEYVGVPAGKNPLVAPSGFSLDPVEYHRKLHARHPELYVQDNYRRNFDYEDRYTGKGVFTVDAAWVAFFPQYGPFAGEKLMIYLIGGEAQAVAVPESLYPRGGGVIGAAESALGITAQAERFGQYVRQRCGEGEPYHAETFAAEYLAFTGLQPVMLPQEELSRVVQEISIAREARDDAPVSLFTGNAKRMEGMRQYMPGRYACDVFDSAPITGQTARLFQPCVKGSAFVSDLWLPYQELASYVNRETMVLNMARLCQGFQIAPRYDADGRCGRYPEGLRVAAVRDRDIGAMVGETLNNPAYGSGMNPQGRIGKQIYLPDSHELLRQGKLTLEETDVEVESEPLPLEELQHCLQRALLQEAKGELIDAMYRQEATLGQLAAGSEAYQRAQERFTERVEICQRKVHALMDFRLGEQMSGYDADIDYLRRKQWNREGTPPQEEGDRIAFAPDALREQSIEGGYAMRGNVQCIHYETAAQAPQPEEEAQPKQPEVQRPQAPQPEEEAQPKQPDAAEAQEPDDALNPLEEQTEASDLQPEEAAHGSPEAGEADEGVPQAPSSSGEAAAGEVNQPQEQPQDILPVQAAGLPSKKGRSKKRKKKPHRATGMCDIAPKQEEPVQPARLAALIHKDEKPQPKTVNREGRMAGLMNHEKETKERDA